MGQLFWYLKFKLKSMDGTLIRTQKDTNFLNVILYMITDVYKQRLPVPSAVDMSSVLIAHMIKPSFIIILMGWGLGCRNVTQPWWTGAIIYFSSEIFHHAHQTLWGVKKSGKARDKGQPIMEKKRREATEKWNGMESTWRFGSVHTKGVETPGMQAAKQTHLNIIVSAFLRQTPSSPERPAWFVVCFLQLTLNHDDCLLWWGFSFCRKHMHPGGDNVMPLQGEMCRKLEEMNQTGLLRLHFDSKVKWRQKCFAQPSALVWHIDYNVLRSRALDVWGDI